MHLNLSCDHIILQTKLKTIKLIGYGSATSFGKSNKNTNKQNAAYVSNQELMSQDKDVRCISPEQTGRMKNYDIDYRSDFYSIGIIFYKMLTGYYPFDFDNESTSVLDVINYHIYKEPDCITKFNPNIPKSVCDMIYKLMSKNAEDRYISANGVIHDIDLMQSEFNDGNTTLQSLKLAQHDNYMPSTNQNDSYFILPQKLYDRTDEYAKLSTIFHTKINLQSYTEYVMIKGNSGTGKSALVYDLYKDIARRSGFFLCGKFDKRDVQQPYSALLEAVNNFCEDSLLRNSCVMQKHKCSIINAIGDDGVKVLTDIISNLHLIIGDTQNENKTNYKVASATIKPLPYNNYGDDDDDIIYELSESFGKDAKNRFNNVFIKLIKVTCLVVINDDASLPVSLALEDLQWSDYETNNILSAIVSDKSITNLMFIGVCRNHEADDIMNNNYHAHSNTNDQQNHQC